MDKRRYEEEKMKYDAEQNAAKSETEASDYDF